jgi:hypothetical protein
MVNKEHQFIELVPGSEIPQEQISEIVEIFSSQGVSVKLSSSVYIRKSAEELPPILVLVIVAAVSGFVGAMSQDMWEALKRALILGVVPFLKKKWKKDPVIQFQFREDDERIIFHPPTETDALMQEALQKLPSYLENRPKGSGWIFFNRDSHEWEEHTQK